MAWSRTRSYGHLMLREWHKKATLNLYHFLSSSHTIHKHQIQAQLFIVIIFHTYSDWREVKIIYWTTKQSSRLHCSLLLHTLKSSQSNMYHLFNVCIKVTL
jgi:hypothetical protein